jgi:N-acyl homoserine lactone hydrolase
LDNRFSALACGDRTVHGRHAGDGTLSVERSAGLARVKKIRTARKLNFAGPTASDASNLVPGNMTTIYPQGAKTMNRILIGMAFGASLFSGLAASAQAADVTLARLDCGTPQAPTVVNERFSDSYAFPGLKLQFVFSCYLIKHGDEYLLWDTGHSMTAPNVAPKVSVVDQLAKIDVKPDQIKYVGISHYHADHTGQIDSFPKATLLIGAKEWEAITSPKPAQGVNFKPFEGWIKGENKVEPQALDKDIFGDGSVIMLRTPGHTPGHSSLLVTLAQMGPVIITGDAVHFRENYDTDGVPAFNFDRAQTVASIERLKKIAANLKATVIIQHDARDVEKLPALPAFAK